MRKDERGSPKAEGRRAEQSRKQKQKAEIPRSVVSGPWSVVKRPRPRFTFHVSRFTPTFYLFALLFFTLGLMSKPSLVPLPFLLLLLDYWPLRRFELSTQRLNLKTLLTLFSLEKLPFLVFSAASSVVTIRAHASLGGLVSTEELPFSFRLGNAAVACALYLRKLVLAGGFERVLPPPGSLAGCGRRRQRAAGAGHHRPGDLAGAAPPILDRGLALVSVHADAGHRHGAGACARDGRPLCLPPRDRRLPHGGMGRRGLDRRNFR